MKIGTLTTGVGVVTTIDLQYCPEYIYYTAATQLTGLKVEVLGRSGGAILDLDAAGLSCVGVLGVVGQVANSYKLVLADGLIKGVTVRLTFTNSAAQTPDIFAGADNLGDAYIITEKKALLLNSNTEFSKFGVIFCPTLAATTDLVTINFEDGLSQIFERTDLKALSSDIQYVPQYQINNLAGTIKTVNINVAATQTIYLTRFELAA